MNPSRARLDRLNDDGRCRTPGEAFGKLNAGAIGHGVVLETNDTAPLHSSPVPRFVRARQCDLDAATGQQATDGFDAGATARHLHEVNDERGPKTRGGDTVAERIRASLAAAIY